MKANTQQQNYIHDARTNSRWKDKYTTDVRIAFVTTCMHNDHAYRHFQLGVFPFFPSMHNDTNQTVITYWSMNTASELVGVLWVSEELIVANDNMFQEFLRFVIS